MDERTRRNLDRADEALARSYSREIPDALWELPPAAEPRTAAQPTPAARPRSAPQPASTAALDALAAEIAADVNGLEKRIRDLEDRITASDAATCELLGELENRIAELERRAPPVRPRLVGGSDAA